MLYFKDNIDGYYQFNDDADPSWYAKLTPCAQQITVMPLPKLKAQLLLKIDADTDAIYGAVVGARMNEYNDAAAQALDFKKAVYIGVAGNKVNSWAGAKGWTATQATDDILAQAVQWRSVEDAIRSNRLARKEAARNATLESSLITIESDWNTFVIQIKGVLGL